MADSRLIFVNRFFYPDISATSQMLADLATGLAGDFPVAVVTSRERYDDPQARLERFGEFRGVRVLRLPTTRLGRARLWRRACDYLTFYLGVIWWLARNVRPGEVVVLMTDPPLLQLVNTAVVRVKGGKVVNWLQDIFPEVAVRLGAFPGPAWLAWFTGWWRDRALRVAAANVVISAAMQRYLAGRGVGHAQVIPNWSDGEAVRPLAHADNPLRAEWGLADKFVVGYSGNFGRAHGFAEIVQAMDVLSSNARIHFLFIGDGAGLDPLKSAVVKQGLSNASFRPYQARSNLRHSLGAADLHLVSLRAGMEELAMPSKVYGVLAAGRPIAFVGDTQGEIARLVRQNQVGLVIGHGDGAGLAEQILELAREPERLVAMGRRARRLFEAEFTMQRGIARWQEVLGSL